MSEKNLKPRSLPKQERAKQTVKKILESATVLIQDNGLENLSTNKIAEHADVNISSIYQYFPNKESILIALIDKHTESFVDIMDAELARMEDLPIREVVVRWLNIAVGIYRQSSGLFPELLNGFASSSPLPGRELIDRRLMEAGRKFLMRRADKLSVADINVSVYVGFNSALMVMVKHLSDSGSYLKDKEVIEGIAEMLSAYFEG